MIAEVKKQLGDNLADALDGVPTIMAISMMDTIHSHLREDYAQTLGMARASQPH